jgi:hypothetical protein
MNTLLAIAAIPPFPALRFFAETKKSIGRSGICFCLRSRRKILKLRMNSSQPLIAWRAPRNGLSTLKIRVKRRLSI